MYFRTFLRSCNNFREFSKARKITVDTHLSYNQARDMCEAYNSNRNARQIRKGTKMEFERQ